MTAGVGAAGVARPPRLGPACDFVMPDHGVPANVPARGGGITGTDGVTGFDGSHASPKVWGLGGDAGAA